MEDKYGRSITPGSICMAVTKSYGSVYLHTGVVVSAEEVQPTRPNGYVRNKIRFKKFGVSRRWNQQERRYEDMETIWARCVSLSKPHNMVVLGAEAIETSGMSNALKDAILREAGVIS